MPNFVHRIERSIDWGHCDPAGIVFSSRFFEFFDACTWLLFEAALGVPRPQIAGRFDIVGFPLVAAGARFLVPIKFGDVVEIASSIEEFRRSSFDVAHRLSVAGQPAVEGRETRVWAAQDKVDGSKIKSRAVPQDVIDCFKRH